MNAQVQFIDFEGRSDGESLLKILSQLRPRRVVIVRGNEASTQHMKNHCELNLGARVFAPNRGETIDATTETHIYQVRLTEALLSQLEFKKGKDAEIAWIDGQIKIRNKMIEGNPLNAMDTDNDQVIVTDDDNDKIYTLEPFKENEVPVHNSVFVNELKLVDFKQVLIKHNISSEFSGGVLWCANGTVTLRRVSFIFVVIYQSISFCLVFILQMDSGKVTVEGALSEEYYRIRELLYEQYAVV